MIAIFPLAPGKLYCPFGHNLLWSHHQGSLKHFRLVRHLKANERQFAAEVKFLHLKENDLVHVSIFWGAEGSRVGELHMCNPPYHPLDFQGKVNNSCHTTLLKMKFKISVIHPPPPPLPPSPPSLNGAKSKLRCFNKQ